VPTGRSARLLIPFLTSTDASILAVLPALRAALNGSGPALRPTGRARDGTGDQGGELRAVPLKGPHDDPHDPTAVAITTSGSTGEPKSVLLPSSALLASAAATHDRLGGGGHWLLALPVRHVAGLQVLVRSLVAGTRPLVMDLTSGFTPAGFAAACSDLPAGRRYTALVPTQLSRLLNAPGPVGRPAVEALRRFDAILIGGAPLAPALREQASAAGVRLVTTYGMSETGGGCVYDDVPLDGVGVRIDVGDGRIRLGGPTLARGYLDDPAATAAAFETVEDARWFRTEDSGVLDGERLSVVGRLDSLIISGGVSVAPGPVEAALQRLPGVADAVVVGLRDAEWGQRVVAGVVLAPGAAPPSLAAVRALISSEVCAPAAPRQLTVLDELPLRGPGKPDRRAVAELLEKTPPQEGP
jgi:O-succinylbenzoic acid--CoA ligase